MCQQIAETLIRDHESQGRQSKHTGEEGHKCSQTGRKQATKASVPSLPGHFESWPPKQRPVEVFQVSFHVLTEDRGLF